jgi:hypothetical protein
MCVSGMIVSINDEDLGMLQKIESIEENVEDDDEMMGELITLRVSWRRELAWLWNGIAKGWDAIVESKYKAKCGYSYYLICIDLE